MSALWEQRKELIAQETALLLRWLALVTDEERVRLVESLVKRFSLPQLRAAVPWAETQVARLEKTSLRGWIPAEFPPSDSRDVLVLTVDDTQGTGYYYIEGRQWRPLHEVRYWRELLPLPKEA